MSFSAVFKTIQTEMGLIGARAGRASAEKAAKQQAAVLQYRKLQLVKEGKSIAEVEKELAAVETAPASSEVHESKVEALVGRPAGATVTSPRELGLYSNVATFLYSQRTYEELLERYNPGEMPQEERVRRTANRVGLSVDELK